MSLQFGLMLFSVRNALEKDNVGTFEKIAEIGYKHLQLTRVTATKDGLTHVAGTLSADEINKLVQRLGMKLVNIHARLDAHTDWDRLIAFSQELGSTGILLPMGYFTDKQSTLDFAKTLNGYGEICRKHGIDFYYHNHFQEFKVIDEQNKTIMDVLLENTDKELVKFELDTYWALRGGVDPVEWLFKLGDRCDMTHQKDLPAAAHPVNWYDYFGKEANITLHEMLQTQKSDQFTETGEGIMDIRSLFAAMRQTGVKYVFVEQDMTDKEEIESIQVSYNNMVRLLNT
ncbi:sugar phosphate isomerase/epimerase family protein [Paenibacillus periandrae]|uniref:sugar phosphate isomerase/epimerase family protein n=1 Tax=Paenibacillus periandrae TaxID=1761741 RepID=UPI001F099011|nr:sugar phosphate isomerase/epimerase [Paenibacillus periandrae]